MSGFYPEIEPYETGFLKVSNLHNVYFEVCGNPNGYPIIFLHGGPGGGCTPQQRRFFDPTFYKIILMDQRGCGRSTPHAELRENTTWDLVADIEVLRKHLKLNRWHVFGGSWGSTLALAYAETHPENVSGLILRGIFLCRPSELKWFYQEGADQIFPDSWEPYLNYIPASERNNMMKAYHHRLLDPDEKIRLEAARIWSKWEASASYLYVKPSAIEEYEDPHKALAFARIECHYFMNNAFFPTENYLLENVAKIRKIPGIIIQGRYDIVCPIRSAWDLHRAWPEATMEIISDAGHSAFEPAISTALVKAADRFKRIGTNL